MSGSRTPTEVFYAYAHKDVSFRDELEKHLSLLRRQGLITQWHDRHILPGVDWAQTIDTHLEHASMILLLISADFLASDYCYGIEMKRALERHQANEAHVIPILLRPVDWHGAPFAHLQALPTDAKAITIWKNRDEAFTNVVAGLRRAIEDLSLLAVNAPRAALPSIWNIPYPRNSFFIGREDILLRLRTKLQEGQTTALSRPQAISGLGGIGKTQVALEYAYRYFQDYQAVLWCSAESREALMSSFVALASLLQLSQEKDQQIVVQVFKDWLQRHRGWLLILDNVDDLALAREFLPSAGGGHILLTTRTWETGRLASRIEIDTLSDNLGALFLLRRAGLLAPDASLAQADDANQATAYDLTHELGGLPLALDQAGAYIEAVQCSLTDYLQRYRSHRVALLRERGDLVSDHPASVATTWKLSFEQVEQVSPAAADLLRACAFLQPDAIPEEILQEGAIHLSPPLQALAADPLAFDRAIRALLAYSLVRRTPAEHLLTVHRLVQAVLKDEMDATMFRWWAERVVQAVADLLPEVDYLTEARYERCLSHALGCALLIEQLHLDSSAAARLLRKTAWYLDVHARYAEAEPLYQRALRIWEQTLGPEYSEVAYPLTGLANLYQKQGKYTEAEPLYQRALRILEQALGPEYPEVAYPLTGLANLYQKQGRYAEAEPLYQRALRIWGQTLEPEQRQAAYPLTNLANLYHEQGRYAEAEPLSQRALHIYEQALGPEHPLVAYPLNGLAELYREQGKYTEAEPLYQRALAIDEQQLGAEHPHTLVVRENYTSLLRKMGQEAEATLPDIDRTHQDDDGLSEEH